MKIIQPDSDSQTGIVEFDAALGGGFPRGATVLLAGSSGSGKTIFVFQWLFEGAKHDENGIYISMTEPLFKSIKNIETMEFYDKAVIEQEKIKVIDLRDIYQKLQTQQETLISGMAAETRLIDAIALEVKQANAKRLCIDSVTAIAYTIDNRAAIRKFIFDLGKRLSVLGCTVILTSEIIEEGKFSAYGVEEFIADVILRLDQVKVIDTLERKMLLTKVRGRGYKAEDRYFKISSKGITVFPSLKGALEYTITDEKVSSGNPQLDDMLSGGVFQGASTILTGASGTGKTILSLQFINEGLKRGEKCLFVGFEESAGQLAQNAKYFGWDLKEHIKTGLLTLRCVYPPEKSAEEHLADIKEIVEREHITRCAVDSLTALSSVFSKQKFSSMSRRLSAYLKAQHVTTVFTCGTASFVGGGELTGTHISTLTDNIVLLRYVELESRLGWVIVILKVRGSQHSRALHTYEITNKGIVIGKTLDGYEGIITGITRKIFENSSNTNGNGSK
jgi:circadian clock protein KaiC